MKKFFLLFLSIIALTHVSVAHAASLLDGTYTTRAGKSAGYAPATNETTLAETLGGIVTVLLSLMGIFFMSLMVYAGYLWMTARGDETQIEKAQTIIRGSIIGLIIILASYSIANFVVPKILEKTTGQQGAGTPVDAPQSGPGIPGLPGAPQTCVLKAAGYQSITVNDRSSAADCRNWCLAVSGNYHAALEDCQYDGERVAP